MPFQRIVVNLRYSIFLLKYLAIALVYQKDWAQHFQMNKSEEVVFQRWKEIHSLFTYLIFDSSALAAWICWRWILICLLLQIFNFAFGLSDFMCLSVVHLRFRKFIVIFWLLAFELICLFDHRLQVDLFQCHINATPATHWADSISSITLRYSVLVFMCVLKQIRSIFSLLLRISFQKCITYQYQSDVTWAIATTTTISCPMSYSIRIRIRKSKWSMKLSKWLLIKIKCDESEYVLNRRNTLI